MEYIYVFFAYLAVDFVWARYNKSTVNGTPIIAANWASIIPVLGGFGAIIYVNNPYALIPAALGSWVGTYISMKYPMWNK